MHLLYFSLEVRISNVARIRLVQVVKWAACHGVISDYTMNIIVDWTGCCWKKLNHKMHNCLVIMYTEVSTCWLHFVHTC